MDKLDKIIKQVINEAVGVMEDPNLYSFAKYLWKRCNKEIYNKPNKFGERTFTIPTKQWEKYNSEKYPLFGDKIQIVIPYKDNQGFLAQYYDNHGRKYPILTISMDLFIKCMMKRPLEDEDYFIQTIMHELTHAVNTRANAKTSQDSINRFAQDGKIRRINASPRSDQGMIEYYFTPTEMNARITEAYYYLITLYRSPNNYLNTEYIFDENFGFTNTDILHVLFDKISYITKTKEMEKYLKKLYSEMKDEHGYNFYKNGVDKPNYDRDKPYDSLVSKLRLNNKKPNKEHTFNQYKKHQYDIVWELQKEYDNFKTRVYKMISKFIYDVREGKITKQQDNY